MHSKRILTAVALATILLGAALAWADEWYPGYKNTAPWAKTQTDQQIADAKATDGKKVQVVFVGDSITNFWRNKPQNEIWQKTFGQWTPLNLGIGSDTAADMRWRLENGPKYGLEPEGLAPQAVVVLAGANNLNDSPEKRAEEIGLTVKAVEARWTSATIVLTSVTPRGKGPGDRVFDSMQATNPILQKAVAGDKRVVWADLNSQMTWDGKGCKGVSGDQVHFNEEGYRMWADLLAPAIEKIVH